MEQYLLDWASLAVRWAHIIVGIAWIGASFYFIWLDNSLEAAADPELAGELHAIHGGGFYRVEKYKLAPPELPATLHWFKWEAYWTFLTGFTLLCLTYYANAQVYLIDPAVHPMSTATAIMIGLGFLAAGTAVYEGLCRSPLGKSENALSAVLFVLLAAAAWGLTQIFSGRGAFIHFGAMIGTLMVANVAHVIIPGQKELVRAKKQGRAPDPKYAMAGKQRSVHNTYLTLPVLFTMISGHYAMTFASRWNWLILIALTLAGALIRVWFVIRHKRRAPSWILVAGIAFVLVAAWLALPRKESSAQPVSFSDLKSVIDRRCVACHAQKPSFQGFAEPPKGVTLETPERVRAQAAMIYQQAVVAKAMPPGNLTGITDEERALIGRWYQAGPK